MNNEYSQEKGRSSKRSAVLFSLSLLGVSSLPAATLKIDMQDEGKAISPDLVGIFYEDLNYAADGGLYAELIQNRSFEYSATETASWGPFSFWDLVETGDGKGRLSLGNMRPVHVNNPHYLLLNVEAAGLGVGVANEGFDQIPVEAGKSYEVSFWAYQAYMGEKWGGSPEEEEEAMPMVARLENEVGEVIAESSFVVQGRQWKQHSAALVPNATTDKARFVLLAERAGGIALDMVSLFPHDTFMGRENGLRKDLAQTIADLKPKFMRFPGGCLVHGQGIHQYYDWKDSVGPLEQRKAFRNLWGYHQTLGLGYHEFFQFSEDMGAIPIPVVSAGVCCQHSGDSPGRGQEGLPLDEMPDYIEDVLDLIEWANGPADSEWGSVRAEAGHPEPFGLKYLGVGNEDAITSIFEVRFQMIRDAVEKRYPDIVVIGTVGPFASGEDYDNGWEFTRELNLDIIDEHYYVEPDWFWENQERYDAYDRESAEVYVGEYAAHEPNRANTMRSAIAEAAGLVSFERNADIVRFASYAPMLSRRGHTQWRPDLIYFDATQVYPTLNYEVQRLFSVNSGDTALPFSFREVEDGEKLVASVVRDSKSGDIIVKVVNGEPEAISSSIDLSSGKETQYDLKSVVFSHENADAVNQDGEAPQAVTVVESGEVRSQFEREFPANSLTILRLR
ncbi:alpha-L-arabinofuranosidase C-terminal domain-containing protein [Pelagicoccus sp. SDUM812002]|uniref:alpha-L-arabinofuranosidase C-terminal domain-containing protein n=1 Tax=Pelagicoccus sp. SDUM812002 TaxID=3041266 RepID=UPI00280E9076|nr:alpha-L-arabinofuranosidase C-terminal domain-containing protein [Pelagicoccus sp. SDUM812002]MDQ8184322.1 alpha-L-arabinofuranosidase C-terminal domain-containing protein [Pelagicoccus sp. SDUM812002]